MAPAFISAASFTLATQLFCPGKFYCLKVSLKAWLVVVMVVAVGVKQP